MQSPNSWVIEMGHKSFANRLVGVTVNRTTPLSSPGFLDQRMLAMKETVAHSGC